MHAIPDWRTRSALRLSRQRPAYRTVHIQVDHQHGRNLPPTVSPDPLWDLHAARREALQGDKAHYQQLVRRITAPVPLPDVTTKRSGLLQAVSTVFAALLGQRTGRAV